MKLQDIEMLAIHAVETIQSITGLGGTVAHDALQAVEKVVREYNATRAATVAAGTLEDAKASISTLHAELASNDGTIDAMIVRLGESPKPLETTSTTTASPTPKVARVDLVDELIGNGKK